MLCPLLDSACVFSMAAPPDLGKVGLSHLVQNCGHWQAVDFLSFRQELFSIWRYRGWSGNSACKACAVLLSNEYHFLKIPSPDQWKCKQKLELDTSLTLWQSMGSNNTWMDETYPLTRQFFFKEGEPQSNKKHQGNVRWVNVDSPCKLLLSTLSLNWFICTSLNSGYWIISTI